MLALDTHTCDFVAGSAMSIRNYFQPSNGLSEPTGSISIALKSREQGTSSLPCARSAEYFLRPVTLYSTSPSQDQQTHPQHLSRQMSYNSSFFTATEYRSEAFSGSLSHTKDSQTAACHIFYMRGSLKYNHSFWKLFHGSFSLACLSLCARAVRKPITLLQTLCCVKIFS